MVGGGSEAIRNGWEERYDSEGGVDPQINLPVRISCKSFPRKPSDEPSKLSIRRYSQSWMICIASSIYFNASGMSRRADSMRLRYPILSGCVEYTGRPACFPVVCFDPCEATSGVFISGGWNHLDRNVNMPGGSGTEPGALGGGMSIPHSPMQAMSPQEMGYNRTI
ncbi:hypothetical protein BO70DRAFT_11075 [Aspergillus heteromorphus CBS 117.55]|uniref:Uncharacterized protein n=1 Tax=Aspergillus heteromorphus CBS 117.55 TaxID=1448321 RepID=A0A317X4D7_9EURO|nr:uncharacterized protein BO70DRAFT_11075 [Aspergillus heteromorphus CBS 117.55]PWY92462.1 hypothetical protein BO70DRAFT_11075 [Aspergillus heteromorphus CBS 117.55]